MYDYKVLPLPGSTPGHDATLVASWTFNPATGEWISYDNSQGAAQKADWIRSNGFGGAMYWELSGDRGRGDPEAIVPLVAGRLGGLDGRANHLDYRGSKWENLQQGMP